jgi:TolA-binding protein
MATTPTRREAVPNITSKRTQSTSLAETRLQVSQNTEITDLESEISELQSQIEAIEGEIANTLAITA